jgi:hypothetical protein
MVDLDTFLTELYVMVDDYCKGQPAEACGSGRTPALSRSETITLGLLSRWAHFPTDRAFQRFAAQYLRAAFPTLPDRSQLNRLLRAQHALIAAFAVDLASRLGAVNAAYEAVDGTGVKVRSAKRRGWGWLDGVVNLGWSNNLGWYEGFNVLLAVTPQGVITGFGFGAASTNERHLASTLLAARHTPTARLPGAGRPASGPYILDKGFSGARPHQQWSTTFQAVTLAPPEKNHPHPWPRAWRRLHAGLRQIVETVNDKLHHIFRLDTERPHCLTGFQARLAASVALHNVCIWLNRQYGRKDLEFADLLTW